LTQLKYRSDVETGKEKSWAPHCRRKKKKETVTTAFCYYLKENGRSRVFRFKTKVHPSLATPDPLIESTRQTPSRMERTSQQFIESLVKGYEDYTPVPEKEQKKGKSSEYACGGKLEPLSNIAGS